MKIEPSLGGEPSTTPLTLDEIKYINNSPEFKTGALEFPPDIEDEVYDELRIDKSQVLKLSEIRDILINPTKDGLIKVISITSLSNFDRVRGQFQKLKYEGYKLTLDIADIIEKRTQELFNSQIKSDIQIGDAELSGKSDKRVEELEKQLAEMKALMESLVSANNETNPSAPSDDSATEKTQQKRVGRSPKKQTS